VFFMGPPLLGMQFGAYPLMKFGDVFDILTPLVLIPLYWMLFRINGNTTPSLRENLVFIIIAALWVEGQGMHLAANSIGHLAGAMEDTDIFRLTYFYDEVLSHYLWHFGIVGLSVLVIYRQWRNRFIEDMTASWLPIVSGIIHGFTLFVIVVEAQTAWLGIPYAVIMTIFGLIWGRKRFRNQPLLLFFFITGLVAVVLFIGWGIYWGGLPEFSEVGIID
ncbi:hypothetical protein ACFLYN_06780, partial [Chloroflexota bacterium]